jgi:hypothetical protein
MGSGRAYVYICCKTLCGDGLSNPVVQEIIKAWADEAAGGAVFYHLPPTPALILTLTSFLMASLSVASLIQARNICQGYGVIIEQISILGFFNYNRA